MHALTLVAPNLSHMDFLDCPLVTGPCRLPYYCTTKDASSNEHINPELWALNRPNPTHSCLWYWPAVFPGCVISSHACIIFLSEASSSSHVIFNIARQRGPKGPERSPGPRQPSPNDEIHHNDLHARYLDRAYSFSYGFSGLSRCH